MNTNNPDLKKLIIDSLKMKNNSEVNFFFFITKKVASNFY